MSDLTDWTQHGIWPLQHHDPSFSVPGRRRLSAARLQLPNSTDDPFVITNTQGDVSGALLWEEVAGARDFLHTWFFTGPGVVSVSGGAGGGDGRVSSLPPDASLGLRAGGAPGGGTTTVGDGGASGNIWLPIRTAGGGPDRRFRPRAPAIPAVGGGRAVKFPKGHTGILTAGTEEFSQQETLHPDWLNYLVAVNKAGDPACGTLIYDLEADGTPGRSARLQSIFSVQDVQGYTVVGLQNGKGGKQDGLDGYLPFVDHNNQAVGWGSSHRGGPFVVPKACPHTHGDRQDKDGNRVTVLHMWTGTNFFESPARDGPLLFSDLSYEPEEINFGHRSRVDLVWDGRRRRWRWQGYDNWYIPEEQKEDLVKPQPPPYPPQPPPPPPPIKRPETGGDPGPDGDPVVVNGGEAEPAGRPQTGGGDGTDTGTGERLDDGDLSDPNAPDDILDETSNPSDPDDILDETGFNAGTGVNYIGEQGDPVYPTTSNCIQVPNVIFKATATTVGQRSLEGANPGTATAEDIKKYNASPQVAHLQGWAKGDGTWEGFTPYQKFEGGKYAMAAGGLMILPPDASVHQVMSGTASTQHTTTLTAVEGLSSIGWGTPSIATGGVVDGFVSSYSAGSLIFQGKDEVGTELGFVGMTNDGDILAYNAAYTVNFALVNGRLTIPASATPTTPSSGFGIFYTKASSPTKPYFRSDDGTEYDLTSSTSSTFADSSFRVTGSSDATKLLAFEVDGFSAGTTRTLTPPNSNGVIKLADVGFPTSWFSTAQHIYSAETVAAIRSVLTLATAPGTGVSGSTGVSIEFQGTSDAGEQDVCARIAALLTDASDASQNGDLIFSTARDQTGGSLTEQARITSQGALVMGEISAPSTPASGYSALWMDSIGTPHFTADGGTARGLSYLLSAQRQASGTSLSYTIPANTLAVGDFVEITWTAVQGSSATPDVSLTIGAASIIAHNNAATSEVVNGQCRLIITGASQGYANAQTVAATTAAAPVGDVSVAVSWGSNQAVTVSFNSATGTPIVRGLTVVVHKA